ncbi:exopolysaccharide biosynthesis polyprenyl glycosylphosphotransferase [Devosia sp. SD17-2]|uniref:exopolysaccharide biosynthesis polyprenyl glycosylphosphotransferase n=1 Tax=Devosia sp. SD17-2 TaxID=2976459 RepID=UPI0023D80F28|nr:exopolysaccharide biosynthesis polyprenyl glycosylphosphotransferase [Devosia sp. SD17-2]WEJ33620.1 exopolysaccharide biosynthesis polyprenyl glycosylphosphotransferase [Devosia sp. SD17-2]
MTLPLAQADGRRRRRFQVPGRATLANGIGMLEGLVAAAMSLVLLFVHQPLFVLCVGGTAAVVYGVMGSRAAYKFLPLADMRQPFALHAALSWIPASALAFLVALAMWDWELLWGRSLWIWLLATPIVLIALRIILYRVLARMLRQGQLQVERFGLIGEKDAISRLRADPRIWQQGGQIVTSLSLDEGWTGNLPQPEDIARFARNCVDRKCQHVLLVADLSNLDAVGAVMAPCRPYALNVLLYPRGIVQSGKINLVDTVPMGAVNSLRVLSTPLNDMGLVIKRSFDIVLSGTGLLLLSPLLLGVAAAIRLTSDGPALYRQERRGFNGRNFYIYKFRSMRVMEDGRAMRQAQADDPRITPIGRFIRRTSIDELPQLINVLTGEMSLVGPRPHAISHDDELSGKFELYAQRQRIKPGITGWAQVNGYRGDTSTQDKIEGRTLHDLYYAENWSLLLDCWIIMLTVFSPRTRQNAH